ncbi:ribonuclease H-like domain-containing protein [Tanacetum coccineum]
MHSPLQTHFEAALRVLRYLKSAPGAGVVYTKSSIRTVSAYADSDWAKCKMTRRSVSGYCVFVFGGLVSCKSRKQATLSRSSAEAEYRSMACATCECSFVVSSGAIVVKRSIPSLAIKDLDVCSSLLYYWWCGYDYIENGARVFEPKREWGEGGVKEKQVSTADKSVEVSKHVNVVLDSNSATRTPNVVNACLESFLTVSEAHGTHSPASVNEENMNDVDTKVGSTPSLCILMLLVYRVGRI